MAKNIMDANYKKYVSGVIQDLHNEVKHNKRSLEKIASGLGITDQNTVKELTELAIVIVARELAHQPNKSVKDKFYDIVDLYKNQVNLSHRTSRSILLQQYSTPAPMGYMMGVYTSMVETAYPEKRHPDRTYYKNPPLFFEPSAGNGLLTIAIKPEYFDVNEIDEVRRNNLEVQGYNNVTAFNAADPLIFDTDPRKYDGIITNPPFGQLDEPIKCGGFLLDELDHVMCAYALEAMKDHGRAAIIVGGHITYDPANGRIKQQGEKGGNRNFYNFLYRNYNVDDILYINGDLYSRQGTSFNVRIILINGRKVKPEGFAPKQTMEMNQVVNTWGEFYDRINLNIPTESKIEADKSIKLIEKWTKKIVDLTFSEDIKYRMERGYPEYTAEELESKRQQLYQSHKKGFENLNKSINEKDYEALKSKLWLHNKFWRKFFEEVTGLKIGNTLKQTYAVLEEYTGFRPEVKQPKIKITREEALRKAIDAKNEKTLNQKVRYDGIIRTRKENVEYILNNGGHLEVVQVPSVTTTRTRYNRMTRQQQEAFDHKEKILKPEYRLFLSTGSFYTISKSEYNYGILYLQIIAGNKMELFALEFTALELELQLLAL